MGDDQQPHDYHGFRFPPKLISHGVWLYDRFPRMFRDAEGLLAQRGVSVTYDHAQRFRSVRGLVLNLFRLGRHLL